MSLIGKLEDVSVVDLLQLLGQSRKSGVLKMNRSGQSAEIDIQGGAIVSARLRPRLRYMIDVLIESGVLSLDVLHEALVRQQQAEDHTKPIGGILLEMGAIQMRQLEVALRDFIQGIINEVARWTEGEFAFEAGAVQTVDELTFLPSHLVPVLDLNPQELLLEAVRLYDEARRTERKEIKAGVRGAEDLLLDQVLHESDRPYPEEPVVVLTDDSLIKYTLGFFLRQQDVGMLTPLSSEDAQQLLDSLLQPVRSSETPAGAARYGSATLVLDTDARDERGELVTNPRRVELIRSFKEQWPQLPILAFGANVDPEILLRIMSYGAEAYLCRSFQSVAVDVRRVEKFSEALGQVILRERFRMKRQGSASCPQANELVLHDLYQKMRKLRHSGRSFNVSLQVMRHLAELVERAVLFLVQPKAVLGLGVFGVQSHELMVGRSAAKLHFSTSDSPLIKRLVETASIQRTSAPAEDPVLQQMYKIIGPPAYPEAVLLPYVVMNRMVSLIYLDNGNQASPVVSSDLLGALVEHASLVMESQLLQRRLRKLEGGKNPTKAATET